MDLSMRVSPEDLQVIDDDLKALEESTRSLKRSRNALAPISRVSPEIRGIIFSFLPSPKEYEELHTGRRQDDLAWLYVSHVCHDWRRILLNQPRFWSRIDFTTLTLAGATQVLSRSKVAPLELEANLSDVYWSRSRKDAFGKQLVAHISHTSRLSITANSTTLKMIFDKLVFPAPVLESLSVIVENISSGVVRTHAKTVLPTALFDGAAPRLSRLELHRCNISWTSPLLKNLRILELRSLSGPARPSPEEWLNAMDQMLQLETLIAYSATPSPRDTSVPESTLVITHNSLTQLHLAATASDCTFALAHLILPSLSKVRIDVTSESPKGDDVRALIPYFSRNAHGPQDAEPLQSILINGEPFLTEIVAWTVPDADAEVQDLETLISAAGSARAVFTATGGIWRHGTKMKILDATLAALPLGSLKTLSARNAFRFPERLWLAHAPRWPLIESVRLVDSPARESFASALLKDTPPEGPLFPALTKLSLLDTAFDGSDARDLQVVLAVRIEQGVPLKAVNAWAWILSDSVVRLLGEMVADVQGGKIHLSRAPRSWPTLTFGCRDSDIIGGPFEASDDSDEDEDDFDVED